MLTPLKSPDKWYKKYQDMSKHPKEVKTNDEKVTYKVCYCIDNEEVKLPAMLIGKKPAV